MEQQDKAIRVVVAEDEPYLRRDIANAIRARQGMRLVGEASTEAESVQAALEGQADVVLMDVEMDRCDSGIRAAVRIARERPETIILFLTVHDEDEVIYEAFSAAPNVDYIVKSETAEAVLQKIEDAYMGRSSISPQILHKITGEFGRMRPPPERCAVLLQHPVHHHRQREGAHQDAAGRLQRLPDRGPAGGAGEHGEGADQHAAEKIPCEAHQGDREPDQGTGPGKDFLKKSRAGARRILRRAPALV